MKLINTFNILKNLSLDDSNNEDNRLENFN